MKDYETGRLMSPEDIKKAVEEAGFEYKPVSSPRGGYRKGSNKAIAGEKANPHEFIRGPIPIPWIQRAADISFGASHLGFMLWHLERLRGAPVTLTRSVYRKWRISQPTVHRLLRAMTAAGLITLELDERRSARVSVIQEPQEPPQSVQTVQ